jgi:hypothetical protein
MDCDWIFISDNQPNFTKTINASQLPHTGDGKMEAGIGYVVRFIVPREVTKRNPVIIAVQHEN